MLQGYTSADLVRMRKENGLVVQVLASNLKVDILELALNDAEDNPGDDAESIQTSSTVIVAGLIKNWKTRK